MNVIKQIQKLGDFKNFSWKEMCSDNNGKTSGSSFMGIYTMLVTVPLFAYECIKNNATMVGYIVTVIGIGAALLGVNKVMNGKPVVQEISKEETEVQVTE